MGPKKSPKSDTKGDDNSWRTYIETTPLNDENWASKVVMLEAAGSDQDRIYLTKFETFAEIEKRFVVKNITKSNTVFMVNQLGCEKKERDESLRVFEEAFEALKQDKNGLAPEMLALLIKHQMLKMKTAYIFIQKQKQELKEGMRQESVTMIDRTEVKGTISKKPEPVETQKPKKGKKELAPEVNATEEGKKYNTLLRERGEEWRDKVYVDDFPVDGPDLYMAITGFTDPLLASCLVRIGVPLSAIVQVRIDPSTTKVPVTLIRASKRGQSQTELLAGQATKFWDDIQQLRVHPSYACEYVNVAFIVFKPPYWDGERLKGDPEKIYDEISFLMYDIQDLSRQHENYLLNMDVIHVPTEQPNSKLLDDYTYFADRVPNECSTISYLLDCLLCAIDEASYDDVSTLYTKTANTTTVTSSYLPPVNVRGNEEKRVEKAQTLVKDVFRALQASYEQENKNRLLETDCQFENPVVINYGDYVSYISFHLPSDLNFQYINSNMLINMPLNKLWNDLRKPVGAHDAKINYHLNVLIHAFDREDVELAELYRLLHVLAFRKLFNNRSSIRYKESIQIPLEDFVKAYLKRSAFAEPLHKNVSLSQIQSSTVSSHQSINQISPKAYSGNSENTGESCISDRLLFDCPDISELISAAELASSKPIKHMIDDFEYFEDFDLGSSQQVLHNMFNEFNCVDYKYCEVTDTILLLFYNSHNEDGIYIEEWRTDLTTPLCMQDFFDFILDENYDWLQKEEKAYDQILLHNRQTEQLDDLGSLSCNSCIDKKSELEMDMLIEGSLKHDELIKETTAIPSETEMKSKDKGKKKSGSPSSADMSKSSKKTTNKSSNLFSTPRSNKISSACSFLNYALTEKPFLGYDLGDRRIEIFGREATFFSRDGTKVHTKYFMLYPENQQYATLKYTSGNANNEICIHRALGYYTKPILHESIRITTKNEVIINLQKETYEYISISEPLLDASTASLTKTKKGKSGVKSTAKLIVEEPAILTQSFYSIFLTCPSGLIVESVHVDRSVAISHIKQYYLVKQKHALCIDDEKNRCISKSGEVIIFKESGEIEVLRPDSSIVSCTKYEKILIDNDSTLGEFTPSVRTESSDKKKGNKDKSTKKDSKDKKPSKLDTIQSFIVTEPPNEPIYELQFQEYVVIEADGKKKHFHDGFLEDKEILLIRTATDFCLGEVFSRRMDGTNILYNNDGMLTVTFPNKTRIVSYFIVDENEVYPEWTEEEKIYFEITKSASFIPEENLEACSSIKSSITSVAEESVQSEQSLETEQSRLTISDGEDYVLVHLIFIIEHVNFATVTVDTANDEITVDMQNDTSVTVNNDAYYKMRLDKRNSLTLSGDKLHLDYEACIKCNSRTICDINMNQPSETDSSNLEEWLHLRDSHGKCLSINFEGILKLVEDDFSEHEMNEEKDVDAEDKAQSTYDKSEGSIASHGKCREVYLAHKQRFFVLRRDLTISELIHKIIIEDYKKSCLWQPWCSVSDYDVFSDNRLLVSILSPVNMNESQKWLLDSKFVDKPKNLVFKHLNEDEGKGFYKWMRPYDRFKSVPCLPPPVVSPGLPKALILRTLEQQWKEDERDKLKGGKELVSAILKYRQAMVEDREMMTGNPIRDPRSQADIKQYQLVQEIAQRTIEKMLKKMEDHVEAGDAKPLKIIRIPLEREKGEIIADERDSVESTKYSINTAQEDEELVQELETVAEMSPNLKKYWKQRAEEDREKQYYREVLRLGYVPPYFENILGGAVWWDINHTADEAVTKVEESKKRKCRCNLPEPVCVPGMKCPVCEEKSRTSGVS